MVRQCSYRAVALAFLLCLLGAGAARAQCSTQQNSPAFTQGGNVFGRSSPQWNQYFAAKVDANNGIACNLTILGTLNLNYGQIVAALGYVPTPLGVITGGTDTSIASASTTDLGAPPTNPQSDVTVTGNATISSFGTSTPIGQLKVVTFTGTPTLVYNVSSMILPGAVNLVVAAKSIGTFKSLGSGNWTMVSYSDATGSPIGVVSVAHGGTGLSSGTSGGVLAFTAAGTLASSGALTANMPVIGGGAGAAPAVGTVTGTGTQFVTSISPTIASPTFVTPALGTIASGNLSAGTVTATGGTTSSSLAGRFGDMLDFVNDLGADPTGVVDVGPIVAVITTTKPIHVPNGLYLWNTNQTSSVNLNLWCDGAAEYSGVGAVPSAAGIQGSWFYRTSNVSWTITPTIAANGGYGGYVAGGIRNCAFAEAQPAITMQAGTTSAAAGFTGTSGSYDLSVSSTSGLVVGMGVSDVTNPTYIPPNTYILGITLDTSITLNRPLPHNVANTDTIKFGGTGFTGTSGTAVLSVASTTGLSVGMGVSDFTNDTYTPFGSTILSIVPNTSITISNNLTHNVSSTDVFRFWAPTVYNAWLKVLDNTGEVDLTGIYCYGVYQCIQNAGTSNGRMRVDHMRAHSFLHLLQLDNSLDSVWIYDTRDWCYWSCDLSVYNWTITNSIPLYMGYANGGPEIVNFFAIGRKACMQTYEAAGNFLARMVNFYCDYSKYGIWNTSSKGTNLQISNALLQGGGFAAGTTAESVAIQDDGGFTAAINAAGSGYSLWDILNVSGGTSSQSAQVTVSAVDGSGHITAIIPSRAGMYTVYPANPASVTGGSGTSATLNLTWGGSNAIIYVDSLLCSAQSVACINGTNTTSGAGITVNTLQPGGLNTAAVKAVNSTGPYYINVNNWQLAGVGGSFAYYNANNAILGGFTLSDGQAAGAAREVYQRYDVSGGETNIFAENKSSNTGAGTCAGVYSATNTAGNYMAMRTCNDNAAALVFGSAVTSPSVVHAGGTLAIGGVSATSILTPTISNTSAPLQTFNTNDITITKAVSGSDASLIMQNTSAGASSCSNVYASANTASRYLAMIACESPGSATLVFGSAITSPSIVHAGGTLAIGAASSSGLTVTGSFTATGLVGNAALANPSTTVNGQTCTLGSTCTITAVAAAGTLTGATLASGVTASSLTSFGSSPTMAGLTVTGSFTATGLVANASLANSATTVNSQTCTLGSTCTVAAAAGTLTGATLASGVTASSLTSFGNAPTLTSGGSPAATLAFAASFPNWLFSQSNSGGTSQLKVSNTGSGAGTYADITAQTHGSGNYYMQFYVDEGAAEGVLTTGTNLTTGMRLQSGSGGIRVDGVNTTTPAGGKNAVCADTGAQPVKIYISSGATC